jgi:hypothetical protein
MIGIMEKVAADAFPNGAHLKCTNPACDRGERITTADCARYLSTGWPTHCGQTMRLVAPPECERTLPRC